MTDKPITVKPSELPIVDNSRIYHLDIPPTDLHNNIILVGDPNRADFVAKSFNQIDSRHEHREFRVVNGVYKGLGISAIGTGIGTDNTEIVGMECFGLRWFDMATRLKHETSTPLNLIRVGTTGTPQKEVPVGALAVTSYAIGLDSTGLYYDYQDNDATIENIEMAAYHIITAATPSDRRFKGRIFPYASRADKDIVQSLGHFVSKLNPWTYGITVSAPGFFAPQGREIPGIEITVPGLQERLAELEVEGMRVVNFEMETSLLCHLANQMGYRAGSICAVIANRATGDFMSDYNHVVQNGVQAALDTLVHLDELDKSRTP